jgi:hypothetical protein
MGGQGALRLAYRHPNLFPVASAISPAIDFHKRYNEGDETIPQMYPDPKPPARTPRSCTSTRSTGRGTSSSAATRKTTAGTKAPTACG